MSTQSDPNTGRDTAERDTLYFDPRPLGEPASVSKLPHFQRNQDRDRVSARNSIPPVFYPIELKNHWISLETLILGKS